MTQEGEQRHVYNESDGAAAVLYSPEDVIVYKLKYYVSGRIPKHLRDIGAIMTAKGDSLDRGYIARWADRIGAGHVWQSFLRPTTAPNRKTCQVSKT
jgi:hypothetical protein